MKSPAYRPSLLITEPDRYSPEALGLYRAHFDVMLGPVDRQMLLERIGDFDAAVIRLGHRFDRTVFDRAGRLRLLASPTTGLNHIDVEAARDHGVTVLSLAGETDFLENVPATAEHTWALLLALIRHVASAAEDVRQGGWNRDRFLGSELRDRRLGILGYGRLGKMVARFGLSFGMRVRVFDIRPVTGLEGIRVVGSLDELLPESDVLSVHIPLDDSTTGLLGADQFSRLPDGAILINTARGEIVDEGALVDALKSGKLAGAGLDVVCHELQPDRRRTSPLADYLQDHDNLLITPHVGGATLESMRRTERFMAEKLVSHLTRAEHVDG